MSDKPIIIKLKFKDGTEATVEAPNAQEAGEIVRQLKADKTTQTTPSSLSEALSRQGLEHFAQVGAQREGLEDLAAYFGTDHETALRLLVAMAGTVLGAGGDMGLPSLMGGGSFLEGLTPEERRDFVKLATKPRPPDSLELTMDPDTYQKRVMEIREEVAAYSKLYREQMKAQQEVSDDDPHSTVGVRPTGGQ